MLAPRRISIPPPSTPNGRISSSHRTSTRASHSSQIPSAAAVPSNDAVCIPVCCSRPSASISFVVVVVLVVFVVVAIGISGALDWAGREERLEDGAAETGNVGVCQGAEDSGVRFSKEKKKTKKERKKAERKERRSTEERKKKEIMD